MISGVFSCDVVGLPPPLFGDITRFGVPLQFSVKLGGPLSGGVIHFGGTGLGGLFPTPGAIVTVLLGIAGIRGSSLGGEWRAVPLSSMLCELI